MAVRNEFRLLLESESGEAHPRYLNLRERGSDEDRAIYIEIAGAGMEPYIDDPELVLSMSEANELRDCLDRLINT